LRSQGAEIRAGLALLPQLLAPQATASRWPCARPAGSWSAMVGRDGRKGGQCGGARGGWRRRKGENVERRWRWPDDEMALVRIGSRAAASQREGGGGGMTGRAAGCSVILPLLPSSSQRRWRRGCGGEWKRWIAREARRRRKERREDSLQAIKKISNSIHTTKKSSHSQPVVNLILFGLTCHCR